MPNNPLAERIAVVIAAWNDQQGVAAGTWLNPLATKQEQSLATALAQELAPGTTEAEVKDCARSIEVWNDSVEYDGCPTRHSSEGPMCHHEVNSLANHLTRNRITIQDAKVQALLDTLEDTLRYLKETPWAGQVDSPEYGRYIGLLRDIKAVFKGTEEANG